MKKLIYASAFFFSVYAQAHDDYVTTVECQGEKVVLSLVEGGFSGIPMLHIERSEDDFVSSENHIVTAIKTEQGKAAPIIYDGRKISFTVSPLNTMDRAKPVTGILYTKLTKISEKMDCVYLR